MAGYAYMQNDFCKTVYTWQDAILQWWANFKYGKPQMIHECAQTNGHKVQLPNLRIACAHGTFFKFLAHPQN